MENDAILDFFLSSTTIFSKHYGILKSINCYMILQRNGCNTVRFIEKSSNHFFGSTHWTNNFCQSRVIWKHLNSQLLFCFRFIGINLGLSHINDTIHMFRAPELNFFSPFYSSVLFSLR